MNSLAGIVIPVDVIHSLSIFEGLTKSMNAADKLVYMHEVGSELGA